MCALVYFWRSNASLSTDGWMTDLDTAVAAANTQAQPMLIDFVSDSCAPCRQLDAETFPDSKVQKSLGAYVRLKVILDDKTAPIFEKYQVSLTPTLLVINAGGREGSRHSGFLSPTELIAFLRKAS